MRQILPDFLSFISPRNKDVKTTIFDEINFKSYKELYRYKELIKLRRDKKITLLGVHPAFLVLNEFKDNQGKTHKAINYEPSFAYSKKGKKVVEDLKTKNEAHEIKKKLFFFIYTDVEYREI